MRIGPTTEVTITSASAAFKVSEPIRMQPTTAGICSHCTRYGITSSIDMTMATRAIGGMWTEAASISIAHSAIEIETASNRMAP